MDDPFVSCPYDPIHRVPKSRLQRHIVKCQKNYPELAICPYNATHRMSQKDILEHVKNCPSKIDVDPDRIAPKMCGAIMKPTPVFVRDPNDPEFEEWDN